MAPQQFSAAATAEVVPAKADSGSVAPAVPKRSFNFSAGPATLPDGVMVQAQSEFVNFQDTGMSFMEISHRDPGGPVQTNMAEVSDLVKSLLSVPDNYHILFMQGGAHGQFAAAPMNLLGDKTQIDVVRSGFWANRAVTEAQKYCKVRFCFDGEAVNYRSLAPPKEWDVDTNSAYVHVCANETIHGLEILDDPELPEHFPPVVADMTSTLFSRPVNVSKYGVIYCSGGKNMGPAGVTLVIVRDDLLDRALPFCPGVLSYKEMAASKPVKSIYNTPPTYLIYMAGLVLKDLQAKGGVQWAEHRAKLRAAAVYDLVDASEGFYVNTASTENRSRMNIPFRIRNGELPELESLFCAEAEQSGLLQLFCHPLFPGLRVTLYNGITDEALAHLINFMREFKERYAGLRKMQENN